MSATSSNIEIGHCPSCREPIYQNHSVYWCRKCHKPLPDEINAKRVKAPSAQPALGTDDFAIQVLRVFAWLNLVGIFVGIYLLTNATPRTTPTDVPVGIALIVEAFFGWAFLLVVCSIAENLIAIRRNTERTPSAPTSPTIPQESTKGHASDAPL
jgi:hypothetical protein